MSQLKRYAPSLLLCFFCKSTRNLSFRYPTKDRENEGIYIIYCPELLIRTTHIHKPIHYLIHTIHKLVTNGIKVIPAIKGRNSWTIQFVCLGFNDMKIFLFVFFFLWKRRWKYSSTWKKLLETTRSFHTSPKSWSESSLILMWLKTTRHELKF